MVFVVVFNELAGLDRPVGWMVFIVVFNELAGLDRPVADLLSAPVTDASPERRPSEALVGEVDRVDPATDARLPSPFVGTFGLSCASVGLSCFLFVIELREDLVLRLVFDVPAATPTVAGRRADGTRREEVLSNSPACNGEGLEAIASFRPVPRTACNGNSDDNRIAMNEL